MAHKGAGWIQTLTPEQREAVAEVGRLAAARRPMMDGICERCGAPFTATNRRQYCTPKCRIAAHRANRANRKQESGVLSND